MASADLRQRFSQPLDPRVHNLNRSLAFDLRLYPYDLQVSQVWSQALGKCGRLSSADTRAIATGLETIRGELEAELFPFRDDDEDIHMAIERRLTELIGEPARKLHFGRSRNDQVTTDLRLYTREQASQIVRAAGRIIAQLVAMAEEHAPVPFPGHTHLQQAQVVSLGHLLLAQATSLQADVIFLDQVAAGLAMCPLGSGALAGSTAQVDREWIATELGFAGPTENSVEAVSSRDFVMDLLYGCCRLGVHLSRLAEDFILWTSQEFGFAVLGDSVATGSSLLAHKKNPDVFELARAKAGRLVGNLTGFLTVLKGLPAGYNKDLQEDKEPLFDSVATLLALLPALEAALQQTEFSRTRSAPGSRPL